MRKFSQLHRERLRLSKLGPKNPSYGKPCPKEVRERIAAVLSSGRVSGARNPNWRGGVSSERHSAYRTRRYKQWRAKVFKRDNYRCRVCGRRGHRLHAHHIKPWATFKALRYEVNNGITVCASPCHRALHSEVRAIVEMPTLTVQKKRK